MHTLPHPLPQHLSLARRALHSLPDAAGLELACHEGTVWITLDNDPRDIVLEPGQSFTAAGHEHRRALVYALQAARVTVAQTAWASIQSGNAPAGQAGGLAMKACFPCRSNPAAS